jgi:hypothetical protein
MRPSGAATGSIAALVLTAVTLLLPTLLSAQSNGPAIRVGYVAPAPVQPQTRDGATIFHDDFDRPDSPDARYFEHGSEGASFVRRENEGMGGRGGAMRSQFEQGQVSAGTLKVLFGANPFGKGIRSKETFREIYWRVYVKHEAGWTGNPAKLGRATCLAAPDWSQGFIAHVWGGKGDTLCIDPATGIVGSRKVSDRYNDFAHLKWLGLRNGQTPIFSAAESGRWVCIESHVRLNTPGSSDGVFELWVDGKPEAARKELDWHGAWGDYAINAVFLENYWNTGSVRRQARWFDEFVISTQPIGPITAAQPVSVTRTAGNIGAWEAQVSTRPDEGAIVWTSRPASGATQSLKIDARQGSFIGARSRQTGLAPDTAHWVRVRQRTPAGSWSEWSDWHAPFRTAP